MKKIILLFTPSIFFCQNVGINNTTPIATLDIISSGNTNATKALKITNSNPTEIFTIQNDGNVGINSSSAAANTAQLNINSGSATKSVLKLDNLSNTKDKTIASGVNYNQFSSLVVDNNGNVFKQFDIKTTSGTASTFDGSYTATSTNTTLTNLSGGNVVRFQILTPDFTLGTGDVLYADVMWTRNAGFLVSNYGYDSSSATVNPMVINGLGTNTLVFNFTNGTDLTFSVNLTGSVGAGSNMGTLNYNITGSGATSVPFNVYYSFKSR
ncbi:MULTISPECIES: hypothetical protein [Chryseobacterium]|jgi:hypothetical protein|uniref:DUF4394 domain-containing protein n=1 Tax=Chryseobacterium candidae TaxID=1978493 RepID=A0ABY2R378_9FLAO|nr:MULTISPECIES: hypothetical protein [Chryseobacterium]THV56656.1 hypothetical protein EK417_18245 [Chryseobacterium candidae]SIQ31876.1 hypothetical protein SAMN05880573_104160 [Chryseobacterium sp. RU33C]